MQNDQNQEHFFLYLKSKLPVNISLVDEVAEVLSISIDSAYRRIRGDKSISFDELQLLSAHFHVSIDQFLQLKSDALIFTGRVDDQSETRFEDYLDNVYKQLCVVNSFQNKHMYFLMKDIPPFVHFQIPELARFKFFFWMRSILHYDKFQKYKFAIDDSAWDAYIPMSNKVLDAYYQVPITEIWNIESINSSIRQIQVYHESGIFKNKQEVVLMYQKLESLINHIELQAELGVKFQIGKQPNSQAASYRMFVNELVTGDNTILAELDGHKVCFLNHSVLYFVSTQDAQFTGAMFRNIDNLVKRSTLISTVGEKERSRFFNLLREKIRSRIRNIS